MKDGKLGFLQPVVTVLRGFDQAQKDRINLKHLLAHQSGLPAHRPYYLDLEKVPQDARPAALERLLIDEPLENPPGQQVVYSDLGFMVLQLLIEKTTGRRLKGFVENDVYPEFGISSSENSGLHFRDIAGTQFARPVAASERCPWRKKLLAGVVHDENAYAAGGVGGHAGLFGTALDVHGLVSALLSDYYEKSLRPVVGKHLADVCFGQGGHFDRPLGFDAPAPDNPSCGRHFSKNSAGHLGFTGTSFWIDLDRAVTVILLTNRVHPSRTNERIKAFRPLLHDAIMTGFTGASSVP